MWPAALEIGRTTTTEVVNDLDIDRAREVTGYIRNGLWATWQLIVEAYTGRAWLALGYSTRDEYCAQEFGATRLTLPKEERQEVIGSLRDAGLGIRAIAAATGVCPEHSEGSDLQVGQFDPPDAERNADHDPSGDPDAEREADHDPGPETVTGIDGKRYPAPA